MAVPLSAGDQHVVARDYVREVTRAAGSSFYWGMRILPEERRDAMFAIYTFCREVDDIADGPDRPDRKRAALDGWRQTIENLYHGSTVPGDSMVARALLWAITQYSLQKKDFLEIIAGMEMDTDDAASPPDCDRLRLYCDRVAGAVGLLSIRVFGDSSEAAQQFALALGTALQLTNILRDLNDDAEMGRLYLPTEQLSAHAVTSGSPQDVLAHPKLPNICASIAEQAKRKYVEAEDLLPRCDAKALRPAIVMMMSYRRVLDRLILRGWRNLDDDARLSMPEKLWITLRYGFL
jgi:squalene synthase HpnD